MKKQFIFATCLSLIVAGSANASSAMGTCLYPKTKTASDGRLQFQKPVYVYASPDLGANKGLLKQLSTFTVSAVSKGGWVQLATVPDYDQPDPNAGAGKTVGWALLKDFRYQAFRNCN